jgi:hypothetical protein
MFQACCYALNIQSVMLGSVTFESLDRTETWTLQHKNEDPFAYISNRNSLHVENETAEAQRKHLGDHYTSPRFGIEEKRIRDSQ